MHSKRILKSSLSLILILIFSMILISPASATGDFDISSTFEGVSAEAAYVMELTTGELLYSYNADKPLPPASTTKMLTTLLVLEAVERGEVSLDDEVSITYEAFPAYLENASRMPVPLIPGERMSLLNLLYANMISSDCFASNVLGIYISGSLSDFIALMNTRAEELGCLDTNYTNPSGYPDSNMHTTAHALYLVAAECLKFDTFRDIVSTAECVIPATNLSKERNLYNTNMLLHKYIDEEKKEMSPFYYESASGIKTGYSKSSGYCLASVAEKGGHELVVILLGCESTEFQFSETIRLFEHYFNFLFERDAQIEAERIARNKAITYNAFEKKKTTVLLNSDNARITREQVMNEDALIVSSFEEKHQDELNERMKIIYLGSCICLTLAILLIIIIVIRKLIRIKNTVHK